MSSLAAPVAPARSGPRLARLWLGGTVVLTLGSFAVTIVLAPSGAAGPGRALQFLLFVGSSVHIAATGWFYAANAIRTRTS
jgi:hypothetical protein